MTLIEYLKKNEIKIREILFQSMNDVSVLKMEIAENRMIANNIYRANLAKDLEKMIDMGSNIYRSYNMVYRDFESGDHKVKLIAQKGLWQPRKRTIKSFPCKNINGKSIILPKRSNWEYMIVCSPNKKETEIMFSVFHIETVYWKGKFEKDKSLDKIFISIPPEACLIHKIFTFNDFIITNI